MVRWCSCHASWLSSSFLDVLAARKHGSSRNLHAQLAARIHHSVSSSRAFPSCLFLFLHTLLDWVSPSGCLQEVAGGGPNECCGTDPGDAPVGGPISMAGGPPLQEAVRKAEVDQVVDPMNVVAQIPVVRLLADPFPWAGGPPLPEAAGGS